MLLNAATLGDIFFQIKSYCKANVLTCIITRSIQEIRVRYIDTLSAKSSTSHVKCFSALYIFITPPSENVHPQPCHLYF